MRKPMKNIIICSLFAAIAGIFSQISIPLAPVPVNLATLAFFTAGGLLGAKYGALSMFIYVMLGIAGVPVFSLMRSGIGMLAGPTGGYIIGYIVGAWLTGFISERFGKSIKILALAMTAGIIACYSLGTAWFIIITGNGIIEALMLCVVPFLIGDALKITAGVILVRRLNTALHYDIRRQIC